MIKIFNKRLFIIVAFFVLTFVAIGAYNLVNKKINQNKNCPKYIDCMPGPGRSAACEIPEGCENITQIAY